jgi:hypothetical protein
MAKLPPEIKVKLRRLGVKTLMDMKDKMPTVELIMREAWEDPRMDMRTRSRLQPVMATYMETELANVGIVGTSWDALTPSRFDMVTLARYKANRAAGRGQAQKRSNPPRTGAFGRQPLARNQSLAPRSSVTCGHCGHFIAHQCPSGVDVRASNSAPNHGHGRGQMFG